MPLETVQDSDSIVHELPLLAAIRLYGFVLLSQFLLIIDSAISNGCQKASPREAPILSDQGMPSPPFASRTAPVIAEAWSEIRNSAARAHSSSVTIRRSGMFAATESYICFSEMPCSL